MKYDLKNHFKAELAETKLKELIKKGSMIELREIQINYNIDSMRLYWVWLGMIEKATGFDKNELHYRFRAMFLQREEDFILQHLNEKLWSRIKEKIDAFIYFTEMNIIIDIIAFSTSEVIKSPEWFTRYLKEIQKFCRVNFNIILLNKQDERFKEFYRENGFL